MKTLPPRITTLHPRVSNGHERGSGPWEGSGKGRGGRPWRRKREAVLKRDGYLCQPCRGKNRFTPATEVHHVIGLAEGGTDDEANLLSVCVPCHLEAEALKRGGKARIRFDSQGRPEW